ncbi:MAG: ABC transporter substrate-binding protein [Sphaerochaeta sp.]|nr:ABC transporter substrate-binding protein [Sphaerochaeta sp.]
MKKAVLVLCLVVGIASLTFASGAKEQAASASKGSVTVYSPHESGPLNAGVKAFQDATGITVDVVAAGSGELLKRIEAEKANPLCDVFWGGGAESAAAFAQYFEPFTSSSDASIPSASKAMDTTWIGESPVPVVIMYNRDLVGDHEAPKGWADLLDPKWKGKIAFADPAKSGSAYTLLCTMVTAIGKDDGKGWDFITKLVANLDGKIQGSSSNSYKLVADGEYYIGLTQEKSVQTYVLAGANVGMVYAKEGTSAVPDSIAIVKGAKNAENAMVFVDFMLGKENQSVMRDGFNRRPVRNDLAPPTGLPPMSDIKLVDYDFAWASLNKAEIINKWKNIVVGR